MNNRLSIRLFGGTVLFIVLMIQSSVVQAVELTGRLSLLGMAAHAGQGDAGFNTNNNLLMADQQSLRLMLDDREENLEWSVHLRATRQDFIRMSPPGFHSSDLFRFRNLSGDWQNDVTPQRASRSGYELDRAVYKHRFDHVTVAIGRQPVDWGSGRFWQPLNVFGAFSPTDLDTDFKPGIDAVVVDWYPSAFSSITMAYVPRSDAPPASAASGVIHFRSQVGDLSEVALLTGSVLGESVVGVSYESEFKGIGWRFEALHYKAATKNAVFWIAGIDYQFEDNTLLAIEWYDNSAGASSEAMLLSTLNDPRVTYGLQKHMGRRVLGMSLSRDITPLLHGSYTLLVNGLQDNRNRLAISSLHQMSLTYSVSNESDLLISMMVANGKGLGLMGTPQSEFGHIPTSATLRYRFYF